MRSLIAAVPTLTVMELYAKITLSRCSTFKAKKKKTQQRPKSLLSVWWNV